MEILTHVLQIANCLAMIGCSAIWFWLWWMNLNNHRLMNKKLIYMLELIENLEFQIKVIKEPCYRGEK